MEAIIYRDVTGQDKINTAFASAQLTVLCEKEQAFINKRVALITDNAHLRHVNAVPAENWWNGMMRQPEITQTSEKITALLADFPALKRFQEKRQEFAARQISNIKSALRPYVQAQRGHYAVK